MSRALLHENGWTPPTEETMLRWLSVMKAQERKIMRGINNYQVHTNDLIVVDSYYCFISLFLGKCYA